MEKNPEKRNFTDKPFLFSPAAKKQRRKCGAAQLVEKGCKIAGFFLWDVFSRTCAGKKHRNPPNFRKNLAKPARRPGPNCREKPSEAVFRQSQACASAGFSFLFFRLLWMGLGKELCQPLLHPLPGEMLVDEQGHDHAHAGIKNAVDGVADIGLHRGVEPGGDLCQLRRQPHF